MRSQARRRYLTIIAQDPSVKSDFHATEALKGTKIKDVIKIVLR